jgi:hypothetical protein
MRLALLLLAACGQPSRAIVDATVNRDSSTDSGAQIHDAPTSQMDAHVFTDAHVFADAPAFPYKLDLGINCHNDCTLIANPSSIAVPAGTKFTVNWINTGDTDCDVAKIDQFNQVPIVLGLEPGTSYYDSVREWCGAAFTGTFDFRLSICTIPSYIPVNCGA